jgi:hypothetical protein
MLEQAITVRLAPPIIAKLKRAAELTYRSVDEVLANTINATLIAPAGLPDDLAGELAAMRLLSDRALQAAAPTTQSYRRRAHADPDGGGRTDRAAGRLSSLRPPPRPSVGDPGRTRVPCAPDAIRRAVHG